MVRFNYLYRDGSNYKKFGHLVLTNPDNLTIDVINQRLVNCLIDHVNFVANQVDVPEVFFDDEDDDDHYWHELEDAELTSDSVTDERSITQLIEAFEKAHANNWS